MPAPLMDVIRACIIGAGRSLTLDEILRRSGLGPVALVDTMTTMYHDGYIRRAHRRGRHDTFQLTKKEPPGDGPIFVMKMRIRHPDPARYYPRWVQGEEGLLLINNYSEKYAYFLHLPPILGPWEKDDWTATDNNRDFYFHEEELEPAGLEILSPL